MAEIIAVAESISNSGCDSSSEIKELKKMVKSDLPDITITSVEKIHNKYLNAAFLLRKQQMGECAVKTVLHSTCASNVSFIKKDNLDWRMVVRAKYGRGVSFSANADYANFHSSMSNGTNRAFIVCDLLVKHPRFMNDYRNGEHVGPIFDTFQSENRYVYTKFDDYTFNPKYVIYYQKPDRTTSSFYHQRFRF